MRGMHTMLCCLSFALLAVSAEAGAFAPDTVATALVDACFPVVATEPASGTPHLAYVNQSNVYHAWKTGPSLQTEIAATGVVGGSDLANESLDFQIMPNGTPIALYRRLDRLEFAMRVNGTWVTESVSGAPTVRGLTD